MQYRKVLTASNIRTALEECNFRESKINTFLFIAPKFCINPHREYKTEVEARGVERGKFLEFTAYMGRDIYWKAQKSYAHIDIGGGQKDECIKCFKTHKVFASLKV